MISILKQRRVEAAALALGSVQGGQSGPSRASSTGRLTKPGHLEASGGGSQVPRELSIVEKSKFICERQGCSGRSKYISFFHIDGGTEKRAENDSRGPDTCASHDGLRPVGVGFPAKVP